MLTFQISLYINDLCILEYIKNKLNCGHIAMLEDMPISNLIYTTEKNLNNIFGFVYGKVIAPSAEELKISFIQFKDSKTGIVSYPKNKFYKIIFTEECEILFIIIILSIYSIIISEKL